MDSENIADYWSVDIPGLREEQVSWLVSTVKDGAPDLDPIPVDPAHFLTLHLDRVSVEALLSGLTSTTTNAVGDSLKEDFEEWLDRSA